MSQELSKKEKVVFGSIFIALTVIAAIITACEIAVLCGHMGKMYHGTMWAGSILWFIPTAIFFVVKMSVVSFQLIC